MKTAKLVKKFSWINTSGEIYQLSPPLIDNGGKEHGFVAVFSTVSIMMELFTYILPSDGEDYSQTDRLRSYDILLDHGEVLAREGYEIITDSVCA